MVVEITVTLVTEVVATEVVGIVVTVDTRAVVEVITKVIVVTELVSRLRIGIFALWPLVGCRCLIPQLGSKNPLCGSPEYMQPAEICFEFFRRRMAFADISSL